MIKPRDPPAYPNPFGKSSCVWGDRIMIDVEEFDKETSERFSVVSYNTLAQNACKEVPYCRPQHLTPVGRRKLFHREIADLDADILGLQDVDNYDLWWREMLSSLGYDSVFQRRSQARGSWEEGLVLAWRRTRFQLVASHAFDFNDVPAEGTVQGYLVQDNVAQMVALQPFERSRAPTGLCVANTQLCRLPGREDVRLAQAQALVRTIEAFNSDFHFPVILTASLYSNPAGQTYGMLATGKLPLDPKAPSRAGKPEVEVDSPSSIRLRWAPSEIDYFALSPYLEGYRIQWRPGGNRFVGFAGEKFVEDEDSKVYLTRGGHFLEEPFRTTLVTGLASGIPYEFRVPPGDRAAVLRCCCDVPAPPLCPTPPPPNNNPLPPAGIGMKGAARDAFSSTPPPPPPPTTLFFPYVLLAMRPIHVLSHATTVCLQAALTSEHFFGPSLATVYNLLQGTSNCWKKIMEDDNITCNIHFSTLESKH